LELFEITSSSDYTPERDDQACQCLTCMAFVSNTGFETAWKCRKNTIITV